MKMTPKFIASAIGGLVALYILDVMDFCVGLWQTSLMILIVTMLMGIILGKAGLIASLLITSLYIVFLLLTGIALSPEGTTLILADYIAIFAYLSSAILGGFLGGYLRKLVKETPRVRP